MEVGFVIGGGACFRDTAVQTVTFLVVKKSEEKKDKSSDLWFVSLPIIVNLHISLSPVLPADPGQPVPPGLLHKYRAGPGQARAPLAWPGQLGHQVCETDEHCQTGQKEAHKQAPGYRRAHLFSGEDSICICGQLELMFPIIQQVLHLGAFTHMHIG